MNPTPARLRTTLSALLLSLAAGVALAQPAGGAAARITLPQADVQWAGSDGVWRTADADWLLGAGDRIRVGSGSRTELQLGSHVAFVQGPADLQLNALAADGLRLTLSRGSLLLLAQPLGAGERIEIGTQNLALLIEAPGQFRIDADPARDSTLVAARRGTALVYGESGQSAALPTGEQALYVGRQLTATARQPLAGQDALELWAGQRVQGGQAATGLATHPVAPELDGQGEWGTHIDYGTVWYPHVPASGWAPYQHGRWHWSDAGEWIWMDDARWGAVPYRHGRWVQIGPRWAWAPGARSSRPVPPPGVRRPEIPIRSTSRERPPSGVAPQRPVPGFAVDTQRRERWTREQQDMAERHQRQWREQQSREAQRLPGRPHPQAQRPDWARPGADARQMQGHWQDQQRRQLQEPHRQHQRFMREQRDALRARQDAQRQPQSMPSQRGDPGRRFAPRERD